MGTENRNSNVNMNNGTEEDMKAYLSTLEHMNNEYEVSDRDYTFLSRNSILDTLKVIKGALYDI